MKNLALSIAENIMTFGHQTKPYRVFRKILRNRSSFMSKSMSTETGELQYMLALEMRNWFSSDIFLSLSTPFAFRCAPL